MEQSDAYLKLQIDVQNVCWQHVSAANVTQRDVMCGYNVAAARNNGRHASSRPC